MSTYLAWQESSSPTECEWDSPEVPKNLSLVTLPAPDPASLAPRTALVRVRAVSLNFRDLLVVAGKGYPLPLRPGTAPCSDGAGEVVATGPESSWKVGDRVILSPNTWKSGSDQRGYVFETALGVEEVQGALRQLAVVDDDRLLAAPTNASLEEAACLPVAAVTALRALFDDSDDAPNRIREGDWVLTQGTGGVSLWAIQMAAATGAKVIATSSSDAKLETARQSGAAYTINYTKHPDWHEEVLRITGGRGVDRVVEVGGAGTLLKSLKATRQAGIVVMLGVLSKGDENGVAEQILFGGKQLVGHLGGSDESLRRVVSMVEKYNLHPTIGETFKMEEGQEAFKALQKQKMIGKIVITL